MGVAMKSESPLKAAVSVSEMCRLFRPPMSRSQLYWHIKRKTFHSPLYLTSNKRPYFTASMVEDNLRARETGIGVNGEYVIFYERQPTGTATVKLKADRSSLLDGLRTLGLSAVTTDQLEAALDACFPKGTTGQDEANVLRTVFRHLKRAGSV